MNLTTLIFIAGLIVAWLLIKIAPRLFVRQVARLMLGVMGKDALANVPEQIQLARVNSPQWKDAATIQQQATTLVRAGFNELGTYSVDKMPGVLIRILYQPQTYVAARYTVGGSDFLTTKPDQGIAPRPFVRMARADKNTPADSLYQLHLKQRKSGGIKAVHQNDIAHEFEDAYLRYMVWKNNKGLKPEEVAAVVQKWAKAKQQSAGKP